MQRANGLLTNNVVTGNRIDNTGRKKFAQAAIQTGINTPYNVRELPSVSQIAETHSKGGANCGCK